MHKCRGCSTEVTEPSLRGASQLTSPLASLLKSRAIAFAVPGVGALAAEVNVINLRCTLMVSSIEKKVDVCTSFFGQLYLLFHQSVIGLKVTIFLQEIEGMHGARRGSTLPVRSPAK